MVINQSSFNNYTYNIYKRNCVSKIGKKENFIKEKSLNR